MGAEQIQQILQKLDTLEEKIDALEHISIKNGGGRLITFKRSEFFQMLYDRPKEQFNSVADNAKRFNNVFDLIWKFATVVALFVALLTR